MSQTALPVRVPLVTQPMGLWASLSAARRRSTRNYQDLVAILWECGSKETPDGCRWDDPKIDGLEINEMMADL